MSMNMTLNLDNFDSCMNEAVYLTRYVSRHSVVGEPWIRIHVDMRVAASVGGILSSLLRPAIPFRPWRKEPSHNSSV